MTDETTPQPPPPTWAIMPVLDAVGYTLQAVEDLLTQTVPMRVLIIDQGSSKATNDRLRELAEAHHPRVLLWSFNPALPSLSAAWNAGLDFCWDLGEEEVLVVNNDVRIAPVTVEKLQYVLQHSGALFVSAVGIREAQWMPGGVYEYDIASARGGPDFSCFLTSKAGHQKHRFDESLIPCYTEDLSCHREYMLAGDGTRIFSVNLPFLHYASGTIKSMSPEAKARFDKAYTGVLQRYTTLWGGGPNKETYLRKGDPSSAVTDDTATTPYLQYHLPSNDPRSGTISPTMEVPFVENFLFKDVVDGQTK